MVATLQKNAKDVGTGNIATFLGLSNAGRLIRQAASAVLPPFVTPYMRGAIGDGVTDDYTALVETAAYCVGNDRPMFIDRTYAFSQKWTPPSGLVLRGPWSNDCALLYTGSGDCGIEVTASIDIDGIVVDGGYTGSRAVSLNGSLVAIHGPMTASPSVVTGIRIGRLRARRSRLAGIVLANISGLTAGHLDAQEIYNHGILCAGLQRYIIEKTSARDIGDLQKNGSRRGVGALFAADPKDFGSFWNAENALPMTDGQIGPSFIYGTTDTSFYIHDDVGVGVARINVAHVDVVLSGKDAVKVRSGVSDVQIGTITARKVANSGFIASGQNSYLSTTDVVTGLNIGSVSVEDFGYDAISELTGQTYGTTRYVDGETAGTSINDNCNGVRLENCDGVLVGSYAVRRGAATPAGAQGHGLSVIDSVNIRATGCVENVAGRAVDLRQVTNYQIDVSEYNCGDPSAAGFTNPTPVTNTACYILNSNGRIKLFTKQPTKRLDYAILADGSTIEFEVNDERSQYDLDVNLVYVRLSNGAIGLYLNPPRQIVGASLVFANDGGVNGLSPLLSHAIPGTVAPFITAIDTGAQPSYVLKPYSIQAQSAGGQFRLALSDGGTEINATRTVRYLVEAVPHSTGWC